MTHNIVGAPFPVLICELTAGEHIICQAGAMAWMTANIRMKSGFGGSGIGGVFSRLVSGESVFQNEYAAEGGQGTIAFRSDAPGEILAVPLDGRKNILAQKGSFLASEKSVRMEVVLQRSLGAGFFSGEGFILQRFSGSGMVFLSIDGTTVDYDLGAGETILMDTGTFAVAEDTVSVDVEMVQGIGNIVAGGEGLFLTRATGPGKIWMQTMPLSGIAKAILKYSPRK